MYSSPGQHVRNVGHLELVLEEQFIIASEVVQNIPNEHLRMSGVHQDRKPWSRLRVAVDSPRCSRRRHRSTPRVASAVPVKVVGNHSRAWTWKQRKSEDGRFFRVPTRRVLNVTAIAEGGGSNNCIPIESKRSSGAHNHPNFIEFPRREARGFTAAVSHEVHN
jgi:hypothetical protein